MAKVPMLYRANPFRIRGDDPFGEVWNLRNGMDRFFDEFFAGWADMPFERKMMMPKFMPRFEMGETESHHLLSIDLPGVEKENIFVELLGDRLHVRAERKEEAEEKGAETAWKERFHAVFDEMFTVPEGLKPESFETEYRDGILRIAFPKVEASKAKLIKVGESKPGFFDKLLGKKEKADTHVEKVA